MRGERDALVRTHPRYRRIAEVIMRIIFPFHRFCQRRLFHHRSGFITDLVLSWVQFHHGSGFITGLDLSQIWVCHGSGSITSPSLSLVWDYRK